MAYCCPFHDFAMPCPTCEIDTDDVAVSDEANKLRRQHGRVNDRREAVLWLEAIVILAEGAAP